ncbi:MAG: hypothetical protein WCC12_19900 [Anaerolineales bacterium]
MNNDFPEQVETPNEIQLALQERQDEILTEIAWKRSRPSKALLEELAELSIALADLPETNDDSLYLLPNHDQPGDVPEPQMALAEGVA